MAGPRGTKTASAAGLHLLHTTSYGPVHPADRSVPDGISGIFQIRYRNEGRFHVAYAARVGTWDSS